MRERRKRKITLPIRLGALLLCLLALRGELFRAWPQSTKTVPVGPETAPAQPVEFSHKLHAEKQVGCAKCHKNPDPGNDYTLPDAGVCMTCHQSGAGNNPTLQKVAQWASDKQAIPWARIYSVPAFAYWSHRTHTDAGQKCESCHGDVASMQATYRAKNVTVMSGCVACHKQAGAPTGCTTCHESQGASLHDGGIHDSFAFAATTPKPAFLQTQ